MYFVLHLDGFDIVYLDLCLLYRMEGLAFFPYHIRIHALCVETGHCSHKSTAGIRRSDNTRLNDEMRTARHRELVFHITWGLIGKCSPFC